MHVDTPNIEELECNTGKDPLKASEERSRFIIAEN